MLSFCFQSTAVGISYVDWDGLQVTHPGQYSTPNDEREIVSIIKSAFKSKTVVKVVGGGLSFSGIQMSPEGGHIVSLDNMNKILSSTKKSSANDTSTLVEVQGGIRLRDLCRELELLGLALPNLGATASQSIVGATATGTHGTGQQLGCIASQIEAFRLVDGTGNVHVVSNVSSGEDLSLFVGGRVGLGALGIITAVTLRTVPIWKMKKTTISYSLSKLLDDLPHLLESYERLQWSWVPYTDSATVLLRENVVWETPLLPAEPDGGCWSSTQSTINCTDVSYKTLTDSLDRYLNRSLYTEMEMFIPVEFTLDAVRDFISFMDSVKHLHDPSITLSAMVRYVAKDDILLSPMYQRATSVISFIVQGDKNVTGSPSEFAMYAQGLEELCQIKYQGRPHWGKVNYADKSYVESIYPQSFSEFTRLRRRLDPQGMFTNAYLEQRLG